MATEKEPTPESPASVPSPDIDTRAAAGDIARTLAPDYTRAEMARWSAAACDYRDFRRAHPYGSEQYGVGINGPAQDPLGGLFLGVRALSIGTMSNAEEPQVLERELGLRTIPGLHPRSTYIFRESAVREVQAANTDVFSSLPDDPGALIRLLAEHPMEHHVARGLLLGYPPAAVRGYREWDGGDLPRRVTVGEMGWAEHDDLPENRRHERRLRAAYGLSGMEDVMEAERARIDLTRAVEI